MEPQRAMVVKASTLPDGRSLPLWTIVWCVGSRENNRVAVEYRNLRYIMPEDALTVYPVPPPLEHLATLDPCYAESQTELVEVYRDESRFFPFTAVRTETTFLRRCEAVL